MSARMRRNAMRHPRHSVGTSETLPLFALGLEMHKHGVRIENTHRHGTRRPIDSSDTFDRSHRVARIDIQFPKNVRRGVEKLHQKAHWIALSYPVTPRARSSASWCRARYDAPVRFATMRATRCQCADVHVSQQGVRVHFNQLRSPM